MIKACEGPQAAQVLCANVLDKRLPVVLDDLIPNWQGKKGTESYCGDFSFYFYAWLAAISAPFLFFFSELLSLNVTERAWHFGNGILRCNIMHMIMFNVPSDSGRVLESQCGLVTPWEQDKNGHRMTNI